MPGSRSGRKAPRGYGWLTNPRKVAHNRAYNRTTVDPVKLIFGGRGRRRSWGGGLLFWLLIAIALLAIFRH